MNIPTFAAIKQQIHKHIFYMRLNNIKKAFLASAALLSAMSMSAAERFVSFQQGDLLINGNDKVEIYMDANDCRGVSYAANALVRDISKVSGSQATITSNQEGNHPRGNHRTFCCHRPAHQTETHQRKSAQGQAREIHHHCGGSAARHRRQRPSRNHLRHLRTLPADGRIALVRLGQTCLWSITTPSS